MVKKIKNNKNIQIEDAFNELSDIVADIEKDNISLEETIELFDKGIDLIQICQNKLKNAEKKVKSILNKRKFD